MKKILNLSNILAVLSSKGGYVGDNTTTQEGNSAFPYATSEIKQQMAERIYGIDAPISEDYFEVYVDYVDLAALVARHGLPVFGDDAEQQVFWFYVTCMRVVMMQNIFPYTPKEKNDMGDLLDLLDTRIRKFTGEDETWRKIVLAAVAYEETYPYNPYRRVELKRDRFKKVAQLAGEASPETSFEELLKGLINAGVISSGELEELVIKGWGMSEEAFLKLSAAEFKEKMQQQAAAVKDVPEIFPKVREHVLQSFKQTAEPKK